MSINLPPDQRHWSIDKRIPIALVLTLVLQTGGAVWWAAGLSQRLSTLEEKSVATSDFSARLVRLETNYEFVRQTLQTMDTKLDRLIERRD